MQTITEEQRLKYLADRQEKINKIMAKPWRPVLTEQQKKEQDEYIRKHNLPF